MSELQRSVTSFRRQGSSGLVWDDKFISGLQKEQANEKEGSVGGLERSRSAGARPYRTVNVAVAAPSVDPPSPKLSTFAFCGLFRKSKKRNT
ncbi:MAPK kinase substrate protein At1g80180 [Cajanus cajan]|uniref:Uncharacterized protein n=1 Tax=Cajanus cajan TaxID=3821 RepID=A0A151S8I7_CAJCA|nr:MAPK kinase substrate protein At1g80180 [Cajanus cajan]KYP51120.1 hypothetical protein KK1_027037 [Cajanus cajan]